MKRHRHPPGARAACVVPFCRRTRRRKENDGPDWICGIHWPAVPRDFKRALSRARRRANAAWERRTTVPAGQPWPPGNQWSGYRLGDVWLLWARDDFEEWCAAAQAFDRLWRRCRRAALEAAAGI